MEGRRSGRIVFNLTARRVGPGGEFNGVIVVSLPAQVFSEVLRIAGRAGNTFLLVLPDGELLTRWPPPAEGTARMPPGNALVPALQGSPASGVVRLVSSFDGERRLISFQRVGTLPLYVTAGLSEASILADWYRFVWLLSAVLLPTTAGLMHVSWLALQRTRRHEAVWSRLQSEMTLRTQAEGALLHAQELEALGQLTGGVAHDFNNLLGIVSNNVYLLERVTKEPAAAGPLAAIGRATALGAKLTRQLLSFARKQALKPETLRLQECLPATHDLVRVPFDGIALAFRLRESRPTLPVILLTGYAQQVETAANAGFVVLGKPVDPALLFRELARALEGRLAAPVGASQ